VSPALSVCSGIQKSNSTSQLSKFIKQQHNIGPGNNRLKQISYQTAVKLQQSSIYMEMIVKLQLL
jgi:hypothetical protein